MKILVLLLLLPCFYLTASQDVYFASDPAPSPDGALVVFSFEDDLWSVPSSGGQALRLTGMAGKESNPRYSPDGKWIAFTGRQQGNPDVYLMPTGGGSIVQLTFHEAADYVSSWSWDSKFIYFTSERYNMMTTYKVSLEGGTPVRLFDNYFNWPHDLSENPITGEYYFTDSWESYVFPNRKKYKGDFNPDIKSFNPKTKEFKQLTDYRGKDFKPSIDKNGIIYFISDEWNDEYNLYRLAGGRKERLTSFESSVKQPQVSADGRYVVFENDYQLYIYDTRAAESRKINISLPGNYVLKSRQDFNVKGKITHFDVSPEGEKFVFVSRGELFVSDKEGKFIRQINTGSRHAVSYGKSGAGEAVNGEGRIVEAYWLRDSVSVIFNKTNKDGWLNWFMVKGDGTGKVNQLTDENMNCRNLTLDSGKTRGVFFAGRNKLNIIDLNSYKVETIVEDEFWAMDNSLPRFSPDDRYILYTAYRNFEEDIFVYDTKTKKTENITQSGVAETNPFWSPDGKYIYLAGDRVRPSYPYGFTEADIYRIALNRYGKQYRSDEFDKLFTDKKDSTKVEVSIDLKGIAERWEKITPAKGNQLVPVILKGKDDIKLFYVSDLDGTDYALWKCVIKPFAEPEFSKIEGSKGYGASLSIVSAAGKIYMLNDGGINEIDTDGNKLKAINTDYPFSRNLADEFEQMFFETWANLEENFYDENFHGIDWSGMKDKYAKYLPHINSRGALRTLLNDMLGELNSSHMGFYSGGDEEKMFYNMKTAAPGIVFEDDNPFTVNRVVKNSAADKTEIDIRPGDVLTAVNGMPVNPEISREYYFTGPAVRDEISLTFSSAGSEKTVKIHPESASEFKTHLYDEWIASNQKYVDDKTDKKIAYVHMKNMGGGSLEQFLIEMTTEAYQRDGLILDLRFNTGGNVHDDVLQFLSQKPYLQWKYRGGKLTPQPNFTPAAKKIVLLVNEQSLSDAEMTATGFKELGLGKIIGTETYRWIIFTSGKGLVDGSFYRLPAWGCYTLDGRNIELEGVKPDEYVKTTLGDRVLGNDPQLDRALETFNE